MTLSLPRGGCQIGLSEKRANAEPAGKENVTTWVERHFYQRKRLALPKFLSFDKFMSPKSGESPCFAQTGPRRFRHSNAGAGSQ
ncbi:hypothetical protein Q4494_13690 [Celeribacter halophilus]|jgi:hypothetical protein|uniref:Uncharacterized protein n=1 Tax=Celeribacter halophilus TaxID=576117 RepID=A0AAW7XYY2_9RHOB|nr:hypothetical protein [Celeribacter halophilus]MDO6458137.1 hypothetical protein [Celeribacter halophilus]